MTTAPETFELATDSDAVVIGSTGSFVLGLPVKDIDLCWFKFTPSYDGCIHHAVRPDNKTFCGLKTQFAEFGGRTMGDKYGDGSNQQGWPSCLRCAASVRKLFEKMQYTQFKITLPWPDARLSPNSRGHWTRRARASKAAKDVTYIKTLAWLTMHGPLDPDARIIHYTFFPKDNRKRDDDNLVASMKPYRDGIATALGFDDSELSTAMPTIAEKDPRHPRVEITISNPI